MWNDSPPRRSLRVRCQHRATYACLPCAFFFKFWSVLNVFDELVLSVNFLRTMQGAECSSAALRSLATGGVYIAGGIPTKILPLITHDSTLVDAFQTCNPSMCDLLARFPLMVVNEPNVGLFGAKVCLSPGRADINFTKQNRCWRFVKRAIKIHMKSYPDCNKLVVIHI